MLAERTADLQRLQAEYANYRKRVERDRLAVREQALANVLHELLPVLDDIGRAREHGELTGGFKSVAESLEGIVVKLGLTAYGETGEPFDPTLHEALMHSYSREVTEPTCVQILQPGYKVGERIIRPARVAVAEPGGDAADEVASTLEPAERRNRPPRPAPSARRVGQHRASGESAGRIGEATGAAADAGESGQAGPGGADIETAPERGPLSTKDYLEKDYYKTLGVTKGATADEIKKSYRKLARKYHPDANEGDAKAEARFKEISEAYTVLSDDKRRKEYDEARSLFGGGGVRMPGSAGGNYGFDLGDLFGGSSGSAGGRLGDLLGGVFGSRGGTTTSRPGRGAARTWRPRQRCRSATRSTAPR